MVSNANTARHPAVEAADRIGKHLTAQGKRIHIVAYGSLVNVAGAADTMGVPVDQVRVDPVTVHGYERAWNVEVSAAQQPPPPRPTRVYRWSEGTPRAGEIYDQSFAMLGVRPSRDAEMVAGVVPVTAEQLLGFGARENNYYMVDVTEHVEGAGLNPETDVALMFMPQRPSPRLYRRGDDHSAPFEYAEGAIPVRHGYVENVRKAFMAFDPEGKAWEQFLADTRAPKFGDVDIEMQTLTPELADDLAERFPERADSIRSLLTPEGQMEATKFGVERSYSLQDYLRGSFRTQELLPEGVHGQFQAPLGLAG